MEFQDLSERVVETQPKRVPVIKIFEVNELKQHYDENLQLLKDQFSIADDLLSEGKENASKTIWRTQIVLLDSALDFFMHEVVWFGLSQIYNNEWDITDEYQKMTISFKQLQGIKDNPDDDEWFKQYITSLLKEETLMSFKSIKKHLKLIGIDVNKVANAAFYKQGCTVKTITQLEDALNTLFWRRNHIAHQSDQSENDAERKDITKEQVEGFISNTEKIVDAIIAEINDKNS